MYPLAPLLREGLEGALDLIYPPVCQVCHAQEAHAPAGYVCAACAAQVRLITLPYCKRCGAPFAGEAANIDSCRNCHSVELHYAHARSAANHTGPLLQVIHQFKYAQARWFSPFLQRLLIENAFAALPPEMWDGVVPVPLHPLKERERGFNQSESLATALATALRVPLLTRLLRRVRYTETQAGLPRRERVKNVANAFRLCGRSSPSGKRLILVDDVMTTGATLNACAKVLRTGGATHIVALSVARACDGSFGLSASP